MTLSSKTNPRTTASDGRGVVEYTKLDMAAGSITHQVVAAVDNPRGIIPLGFVASEKVAPTGALLQVAFTEGNLRRMGEVNVPAGDTVFVFRPEGFGEVTAGQPLQIAKRTLNNEGTITVYFIRL